MTVTLSVSDNGHMDTPSIHAGSAALERWGKLVPAQLKHDPRQHPELMELAIDAAQEHVADEVRRGRISATITGFMMQHGMCRPAAQQVAMECATRARDPGVLMPLLAACDELWARTTGTGDCVAALGVLTLKAKLQGALAPKQSETKVTISVADELAKRTKAIRERKDAQARVVDEPVRSGAQRLALKITETLDK